ncbi:hypothetical protein TSHO111613_22725 [Tsukamurella hominis]
MAVKNRLSVPRWLCWSDGLVVLGMVLVASVALVWVGANAALVVALTVFVVRILAAWAAFKLASAPWPKGIAPPAA